MSHVQEHVVVDDDIDVDVEEAMRSHRSSDRQAYRTVIVCRRKVIYSLQIPLDRAQVRRCAGVRMLNHLAPASE